MRGQNVVMVEFKQNLALGDQTEFTLELPDVCRRSVNLGEPNVNARRHFADGVEHVGFGQAVVVTDDPFDFVTLRQHGLSREGQGGFSNVIEFVSRGKSSQ